MLANLLENARRHSHPGGTVTVRSVLASGPAGTTDLVIQVVDQGDGIAAEHLPQVFERFFRAEQARSEPAQGSGIGLTISKAIVEAHGGTLSAASAGLGAGSTFTLTLPARAAVRA